MNTSTIAPEIVAFARGVREALGDLPADEVDDLTEGLEADLAESLAEDLRRTLPDPVAYAAELRLAAGLPGREPTRGTLARIGETWADARLGLADVIARNPALASVADFLSVLRPAWWIVRAWLATWLLAVLLGSERGFWFEAPLFVPLAGAILLSVQWGRGRWGFPGLRGLVVVGNVVALVALLPVVATASDVSTVYYSSSSDGVDMTGVLSDGVPVTNIFAFDAAGNPLQDVQLFDQDGNPLETAVPGGNACFDEECTTTGLWAPVTLSNGVVAWNVFPMKIVEAVDDMTTGGFTAAPGAAPTVRTPPFERATAVVTPEPVAQPNQ